MPRRPPVRSVHVMNTAAQDHPSGSLRISDADRDRAISELSEHYQAGRLTTEELEDRTAQALQARTAADLAALFTDLPRQHPPVTAAAAAPPPAAPFRPARMAPLAIIAVVILAAVVTGHPGLIALLPVLVLLIVRRLTGRRGRRAPGEGMDR
jgi:Domain of unknown function (DUF1707)